MNNEAFRALSTNKGTQPLKAYQGNSTSIRVHAWEFIVVDLSSNVKVVPNLTAQTVMMAKKIMRLNSAKYVDHSAPHADTVRKMSVIDVRCALYER